MGARNAVLLENAKSLITEFCAGWQNEIGSVDFSDLSKVPIVQTATYGKDLPTQAYVDLKAFRIDLYLGDVLTERRQYSSLNMLIEHELKSLDFTDLTYFPGEQIKDAQQRMDRPTAKERVARNELPAACFSTIPSTGELVVLRRGVKGYFRCEDNTEGRAKNQQIADFHNRLDDVNPAQLMAMEIGSLSGFDVPGANPQTYLDQAKCLKTYQVNAVIKDTVMSTQYPTRGKLFCYSVAGREMYYLEPQTVPDGLMGVRNDVIIHADMVDGRPLVPVKAPVWTQDKGCSLELANGCYTHGKEICENYRVLAKARVGPVEYAFGELPTHPGFFVTWERTPGNDGNGAPSYYSGKFFDSRQNALQNFTRRASEKFQLLAEERKPSIRAQLAAAQQTRETEQVQRLIDMLDKNMEAYRLEWSKASPEYLVADAGFICAVKQAYQYLTDTHRFTPEEVDTLLKMKKPLHEVAVKWRERMDDLSDFPFALDDAIKEKQEAYRRETEVR